MQVWRQVQTDLVPGSLFAGFRAFLVRTNSTVAAATVPPCRIVEELLDTPFRTKVKVRLAL